MLDPLVIQRPLKAHPVTSHLGHHLLLPSGSEEPSEACTLVRTGRDRSRPEVETDAQTRDHDDRNNQPGVHVASVVTSAWIRIAGWTNQAMSVQSSAACGAGRLAWRPSTISMRFPQGSERYTRRRGRRRSRLHTTPNASARARTTSRSSQNRQMCPFSLGTNASVTPVLAT